MPQVDLDCRNFKCPSNMEGECRVARVTLEPVGGILDRLICVECTKEEEEKVDDTVTIPKDKPDPNPDE